MGSGSAGLGGAKPPVSGTAAGVPSPLAPGDVSDTEPRRVGVVTHYYEHAGACVVALDSGELRLGDTIHVRGHTTDFYQRIDRLERDHVAIDVARTGEEVGVQVSQRVRDHDVVYRLRARLVAVGDYGGYVQTVRGVGYLMPHQPTDGAAATSG